MIIVTALYAERPGGRFDLDYYVHRHIPMARERLAPFGLGAVRLIRADAGSPALPVQFRVISEMTFPSLERFDAAMAAHGEALFADLPNYTDLEPRLQVGSLVDVT